MRFPPPEVIATWPRPNYKNPVNRGPTLMIVELTILPLALVCLGLRLYVRMHVIKKSWWDDWLMVAAAFCCCGVTVSVILGEKTLVTGFILRGPCLS
jgi:putative effector of murein hydrolase